MKILNILMQLMEYIHRKIFSGGTKNLGDIFDWFIEINVGWSFFPFILACQLAFARYLQYLHTFLVIIL